MLTNKTGAWTVDRITEANGIRQCKEIWIAAIEEAKLETSQPSQPEDEGEDDIGPSWTLEIQR